MAEGSQTARLPITAIILTLNEERHIGRAIASLNFAERVVVVDSGSTDRTRDIALKLGADVFERKWLNYADQAQWAIEHTGIATPWILRLDADEVIEPDLVSQIRDHLPDLPDDVTGINFNRKHIFMGRWVRHGGRYPLTMLRLWRTGLGRIEARWMDEHIIVSRGRTITLTGGFADINLNDARYFTDKHNSYATREAIDVVLRKYRLVETDEALNRKGASFSVSRKRWIKQEIYNRLPLGMGPLLLFIWRFVFQLGFLDGREGRIYHVLQGFWYRYLVDVRKLEFEQAMTGAASNAERLKRLAAASGYSVADLATASNRNSRDAVANAGLPE